MMIRLIKLKTDKTMVKKIKFPLAIKENNLLISVFVTTTLALSLACTPARQMAQQKTEPVSPPTRLEADNHPTEKALLAQPSADESLAETNSSMEIWEQPLTPQAAEEKAAPPPFRKQRFSPATPQPTTLAEESPQNIDDFMGTPDVKRVQMEEQIDETATNIREKYVENLTSASASSTARMDHDKTNEKIEEVLIQLVAQHETIIQLMEQQMNKDKLSTVEHTTHEPLSTEQPESVTPDFAQKTVMEDTNANTDGIVKVSISAGRSVLIDENVLIEWEQAIEAMERGEIPRIKLPAWILQGLEWLTHAPAQEPVRSQTIMPLYRHMKYAGHLSQVNMNSMTPAEVVATLRIFVDEMKQKKGQIRKA